jgi:hypothetical protein
MSKGVRKLNGKLDSKATKKLFISKSGGETVWRNEASQDIDSVLCYVPYTILCAMRQLERMVPNRGLEYGLYLKGKYEDGVLDLSEEFMIPEQIVTAGTIDFIEDDHGEFNGVIHRHPMNMKVFSQTDKTSINQNYEFSLLYVNEDIPTGIINLEIADGFGRVQLPLEIYIEHPTMNLDHEEVKEKIRVRKPPQVKKAANLPNAKKGQTTQYGLYKPTPPVTSKNGGLKRFDGDLLPKADPAVGGGDVENLSPDLGETDVDIDLDAQAYLAYLNDCDPDELDGGDGGFHNPDMNHFLVEP